MSQLEVGQKEVLTMLVKSRLVDFPYKF